MAKVFFAKSCILDVSQGSEYATDSVLKDQIVVTTINGTPDVLTFLETASRILHNFKEDKVSRNALPLVTFSGIILIFPTVLKSYPYFPVYGQNRRFSPYTDKYGSEKTRVFTYFPECLTRLQ